MNVTDAVPVETPVSTPVVAFIVPAPEQVHVPPAGSVSVRFVVVPWHILVAPLMG